jgi:hypothetical protein
MMVSGFGPLEMPWQSVSICFPFFFWLQVEILFFYFLVVNKVLVLWY